MKKQLLIIILGAVAIQANAQLKVGANPQTISSGAVLQADANGTRDAFYLPRVALTGTADVATVANPQAGFTVYNTATAGVAPANVTPGYYYYDGSRWIKILGSATGTDRSIYDIDGSLSGNRLVTQGANTLAFTGSAANAFSIDGSTFSVDAASHKVGIGTAAPDYNLDINGTARITSLPAYAFGGADAVLAIDPTTSQLKQFNFNQYGCPGCAVHENLTTHVIPNGVTAYYDYDGNYTGTVILPVSGRYIGDMFTYDHLATLGSTVKSTNTSMLGDLLLSPPGTGACFVWNGSKWMLISNTGTSSSAGWSITGSTGTNYATNFLGTNDNTSLRIRTNNVQRAIIDSTGKVGIGTTTPNSILDLGATLSDQKLAVWNNATGTDFYGIGVQPGQLRFTASSQSVTGINTMILNNDRSVTMGNGATLTTGGVWTNASDIRLKKNIVATNYGLNEVMQLHPVNYEMKETGEPQVGFIAQEVRKIIPEVVFGKEGDLGKNETLSMSYGNLVPVLTKAIQEQQVQIEEMKAQNAKLVAAAAALAREIRKIKKMMHKKQTRF